ncbi:hypothetical protein C0995_006822, partial [Termitomyces sp. Mi166
VPQDQGFNLINGPRLSSALQGSEASPSSEYGLAYGFLLFGMGNAGQTQTVQRAQPSEMDKPHTFASNQAQIVFATSYLQGIALDHYTAILHFNPSHPLFTNWQAFVNKFFSKFGVFDMVTKAERKLMSLRMGADKCFITFVVQFKKEAYKTGWNYNALRFQLREALPECIHDVPRLALKQPTYKAFKNLITQIDQHHWHLPYLPYTETFFNHWAPNLDSHFPVP